MVKQALVVLALVGLAFSAPQPRKLFHEHMQEFVDIIMEETGDEIGKVMEQYLEYDEFWQALEYTKTNNFKDLIYELESLPEFVAVVDFLENDNIDMHYFLDWLNDMLENVERNKMARQSISGSDLSSFIRDAIEMFPKSQLSALFDQKMSEDEQFRTAIENLQSEEWDVTLSALWANEVFQAEVKTLADNGIEIDVFLDELVAVFGQN